jgi:hypothetical protein
MNVVGDQAADSCNHGLRPLRDDGLLPYDWNQERAVQHQDKSLSLNDKVAVVRLEAVHEAVTSEVAARRRSGS